VTHVWKEGNLGVHKNVKFHFSCCASVECNQTVTSNDSDEGVLFTNVCYYDFIFPLSPLHSTAPGYSLNWFKRCTTVMLTMSASHIARLLIFNEQPC